MTNSWQNEDGEPIMSGEAWRYEQSLDAENPPYDPDDYLPHDDEDEDEDEAALPSGVIPGTLTYNVTYGVRGEVGVRTARVVIGGTDAHPTEFGDIPRILSVKLWGTQDTSRIFVVGLALDVTASDLRDND